MHVLFEFFVFFASPKLPQALATPPPRLAVRQKEAPARSRSLPHASLPVRTDDKYDSHFLVITLPPPPPPPPPPPLPSMALATPPRRTRTQNLITDSFRPTPPSSLDRLKLRSFSQAKDIQRRETECPSERLQQASLSLAEAMKGAKPKTKQQSQKEAEEKAKVDRRAKTAEAAKKKKVRLHT